MSARGALGQARSEQGFTLIEVLVATIVLAVGVLGTASLLSGSEAASYDSELQQLATEQAERSIEQLRSLDYAEIGHEPGGLSGSYTPPGAEAEEIVIGGSIGPSQQQRVIPLGSEGSEVEATIDTFVTWRDEPCSPLGTGETPIGTQLGDVSTLLDDLSLNAGSAAGSLEATLAGITIPESLGSRIEGLGNLADELATDSDLVGALTGDADLDAIDLCDLTQDAFDALAQLLALPGIYPDGSLGLSGATEQIDGLIAEFNAQTAQVQALIDDHLAGTQERLDRIAERDDLAADVAALVTQRNGLTAQLSGLVCSLPLVAPLCASLNAQISALNTQINDLNDQISALEDEIDALTDEIAVIEDELAGLPGIEDLVTELNDALAALSVELETGDLEGCLDETLGSLEGAISTGTENTKRITVEVTVEAPNDAGPQRPVVMTTVVTDPAAGLLADVNTGACSDLGAGDA